MKCIANVRYETREIQIQYSGHSWNGHCKCKKLANVIMDKDHNGTPKLGKSTFLKCSGLYSTNEHKTQSEDTRSCPSTCETLMCKGPTCKVGIMPIDVYHNGSRSIPISTQAPRYARDNGRNFIVHCPLRLPQSPSALSSSGPPNYSLQLRILDLQPPSSQEHSQNSNWILAS